MNKRLIEIKEKFRMVFLSGVGPEVLGIILEEYCRLDRPCNDEETGIRQTVGLEILSIMDLWFGKSQNTTASQFINKLASGSVETVRGRSRKEK